MKFSDERELLAAADMRRETRPLPMASRPRLQDFVEVLAENRWLVLLLMALALLVGGVTTLAIRPVYEANLLIQIADPAVPARRLFGDAANVLEMKTPATAEMEIMRSRMVVSPAAEKNKLPIVAQPRPWPIAGGWRAWFSQHSWKAALFGLGGRARDAQAITVSEF